MSKRRNRNRNRNYSENYFKGQVTPGASTVNMPYNTAGAQSGANIAGNMPGITKPSYINDLNPYNMGTLPQDIPVQDPRFDIHAKRPFEEEVVTRKIVWDYFRTAVALPNPSKILGQLNENIEAFDAVLADGRVKLAFNNRRSGLNSLKYTIDQNGAPARLFKMVQQCFENFDVAQVMSEMALAAFYGYVVSEVNWKVDGGLIIPETIIAKAPRWFVFSDNNELRIKTKMQMVLGEALPPRKFIVTKHHPMYENPYGEPLAEACYWPAKFRHILTSYMMQFAERYATPWVDVAYATGLQESNVQKMIDLINHTFQNGIIAHPDNTKITPLPIGDSKTSETYIAMMDMFNREIDMTLLGCNLATEIKGGSFAASQSAMGVRSDIVDEDKRMVECSFNELIKWVAYYNFGANVSIPKFRLYKVEPATLEQANIFKILVESIGVRPTAECVQRIFQLNQEDFTLEDPMAIKLAQQNIEAKVNLASQSNSGGDDGGGNSGGDKEKIREATIESSDSASNTATKTAMSKGVK